MEITKKDQGTILPLVQDSYILTWVENFLIDRKAQNVANGTLVFYKTKLKLFIAFCDSQLITLITQLTPDIIRLYLLTLAQSGHNPGGIHCAFRTLRSFLYWWENEVEPEGWKNPIRKVKPPKVAQEPLKPISREDFDKLLETCKRDWYGIRDRAILLSLLDSGMRAGELIALNIADLDINMGEILIRHSKNKRPRYTFVGTSTRRSLRKWLLIRGSDYGPLFLSHSGERLSFWGLNQIIRRRATMAGIPKPGLHDFRRAFCLAQLQAGVPETTIARLMGHTTTQLISLYARQSGGDLRALYRSAVDDNNFI